MVNGVRRHDLVFQHGTPGLEPVSAEQTMTFLGEPFKLRDEDIVRFIGFSVHSYFDKALALIFSGGFDQCILSYGYIPRGHNRVLSVRMLEPRNACVTRAHELGVGIAAMKVIGAGVLRESVRECRDQENES